MHSGESEGCWAHTHARVPSAQGSGRGHCFHQGSVRVLLPGGQGTRVKLAEMCPDVEVQFQPDEQTEEVLEQVHAASAEIKARLRFLPQHAIDTMQDTLDMFLPPKFLDISKLLVEVDSVRCFIFTALNANPSSEGKGNEADWGAVLELLDCLGFVLEKLYGALLTAPQFGGVGGSDSDSDSDAESDSDDYDDDGDDAEEDGGFISDEDAGSE